MYLLKLEQILAVSSLVLDVIKWDPFNPVVIDKTSTLIAIDELIYIEDLKELLRIKALLESDELQTIDIRVAVKALLAEAIK